MSDSAHPCGAAGKRSLFFKLPGEDRSLPTPRETSPKIVSRSRESRASNLPRSELAADCRDNSTLREPTEASLLNLHAGKRKSDELSAQTIWLSVDNQALRHYSAGHEMGRSKHPKKEIEVALRYAEQHRWRVEIGGSHAWGRMYCPYNDLECRCGEFCITSIWSTPKNAWTHARQLKRVVDNCAIRKQKAAAAERDGDEE